MRRYLIGAAVAALLVATAADAQNAPHLADDSAYAAALTITVGSTVLPAPSRGVAADCTGAGTVTLTLASGGSMSWTVAQGHQNQPYSITGISASTATCTFYALY